MSIKRATNETANEANSGVSLSLQSLINARHEVPYPTQPDVQGLSPLSGQVRGRKRGQGLEFEDLRNYTTGDDVRHIDWKVSARHNQLYTRLYREEKEQRITLILDFTSTMFTGSKELRAVQAGRMAANLAWYEVGTGGRCGLMIKTDDELIALRPALGDKAALGICAEIANQFERVKTNLTTGINNNTDRHTRIHKIAQDAASNTTLLEAIRSSGRESGAFIILAGLDVFDSREEQHLNELCVERQIAVVCIEDPLEYAKLPEGNFRYQSNGQPVDIVLTNQEIQALLGIQQEQQQRLDAAFNAVNVPLLRSREGIDYNRAVLHQLGFLA